MDLVNIDDYEGLYKFDRDLNQAYNVKTKKYSKNCLDKYGNYYINLNKDSKTKQFRLNHLIYKYNNQDNPDNFIAIDDYEDYKFDKQKNQVKNIITGKYLKNVLCNTGYYVIQLSKNGKGKYFKLHRLVFKSHNTLTNIEGLFIDHVDHDRLNNNINNLRIATRSENGCNRKVYKNNKSSGIKNIYKTKYNTFTVNIIKDKKSNSKTFKSLEEAIIWRDIKLSELHGKFACFN